MNNDPIKEELVAIEADITGTSCRFTMTADGPIPHLAHPVFFFAMPVRLMVDSASRRFQQAVRSGGKLVYALPGGGSYVAP